jgi:ADP-heptose:LPS heptosyltransferase
VQTLCGHGKFHIDAPGESQLNTGERVARARGENEIDSGRCLLVFPGALGDFLCFLPTAEALRRTVARQVTLITHRAYRPLLDERFSLFDIDRREVAALFAPDNNGRVEQLFGRFGISLSWAGSKNPNVRRNLVAITDGTTRVFRFDEFRTGLHAADHFARCAGVSPGPTQISVHHDARRWARALADDLRVGRDTLVLHPGSGSACKNWEGMPALAREWRRRGGKVVAIIGPADAEIDGCDALIREQPLDRIAAFLEISPLFVGNDSGVSHLAAAVSCHGVALFGDTDPTIWRPRSGSLRVVHAPTRCRRCDTHRFCTHRLTVADVLKQVDRVHPESYLRR